MKIATGNAETSENKFIRKVQKLIHNFNSLKSKESKMIILLDMINFINDNFKKLLYRDQQKWYIYAAIIYNKTTQFSIKIRNGKYNDIADKDLVEKTYQIFINVRTFLKEYFINLNKKNPCIINIINNDVLNAYKNIEEEHDNYVFLCEREK